MIINIVKFASATMLVVLLFVCGAYAVTSTQSTSIPATKPAPQPQIPRIIAQRFLTGLEGFLIKKGSLDSLITLVSDQAVQTALSLQAKKPSELSGDQLKQARKDVLRTWAAVINFYAGHINYEPAAIHSSTPTDSNIVPTIQIFFPASHPGYPRAISIVVVCVKEEANWKIKYVSFAPPK